MLLQTFLPIAFGAADVANIAVCTSVLINYTRIQRYWKFVLEGEIGGKSLRYFEQDFKLTNGRIFRKALVFFTDQEVDPRKGRTTIVSCFGTV